MTDTMAQGIAATLPVSDDPDANLPRHSLNVLDHTGHSQTIWDPNNDAEVAAAKSTFDTLSSKGYVAYCVKADGTEAEVMKTFDPKAKAMIMRPAVKGG